MNKWIVFILLVFISMCGSQTPKVFLANDSIPKQIKADFFENTILKSKLLKKDDEILLLKHYLKTKSYYTKSKFIEYYMFKGFISDLNEIEKLKILNILRAIEGKAISDGKSASDKDIIKIAACFPLSGKGASTGQSNKRGVEIAIEEFEEKNLLLGKKIEVIYFDTRSNEFDAKKVCEKIIKTDVIGVIGPNWSGNAQVCAPLFQKKKLPTIMTLASRPDLTKIGDYIFRICFTDDIQGTIMAKYALDKLKAKSALILFEELNAFTRSLSVEFEKSFKLGGGQVKTLKFTTRMLETQEGVDRLLERIKQNPSDVIFLPSYHPTAGPIIKMARLNGITKPIFLSGDGWGKGDLLFLSGERHVLGAYSTVNWHPTQTDTRSINFILRYARKYKVPPYQASAVSYDATHILLRSIQIANSTEGSKIKNVLKKSTFSGVTGDFIRFNEFGDPIKPGIIQKIVPFGAIYVATVK